MSTASERMATATVDGVFEPDVAPDVLRRAARFGATALVLVLFGYCLRTAWDVLQGLGRVSVADVAQALRVVSVRDAILCLVGYRIGRELLTVVLQTRKR